MNKFLSVLMSVYNGEKYINRSIESVLKQSYNNFEFIIIDDGSTDKTVEIIENYKDDRIVLLKSNHQGLIKSLNLGLETSKGELIARMDADDVSLPNRFLEQTAYLNNNLNIGMVSTAVLIINKDDKVIKKLSYPKLPSHKILDGLTHKINMKPIIHPTVMIRRDVIQRVGGYRFFKHAEDKDLWLRIVEKYEIGIINKPLLLYRNNLEGISKSNSQEQFTSSALAIVNYEVKYITGIDLYEKNSPILGEVKLKIEKEYESTFLRLEYDFSNFKNLLHHKNYFFALGQLINMYFTYGFPLFFSIRRKKLRKLIDIIVINIIKDGDLKPN